MIEIDSPLPWIKKSYSQSKNPYAGSPKYNEKEIVRVKVLKSLSPNDVLVLMQGKTVMARTPIPLKEGMSLPLLLEKSLPTPTFRLLETPQIQSVELNTSVIVSAIKDNIWKTIIGQTNAQDLLDGKVDQFIRLMCQLSQKIYSEPASHLFNIFLNKCGINWEKKLRNMVILNRFDKKHIRKLIEGDLKGLAGELIGLEEEPEWAERFVSVIKQLQLLNHIGLNQGRKIFLPIPMHFADGSFSLGQLLIHLHEKKKNEEESGPFESYPVRITFLLELSKLGPLRVDLFIRGKEINGRFLSEDRTSKVLLEEHLQTLNKNLTDKGFFVKQMECRQIESKILQDSLIHEIVPLETCSVEWVG